MCETKNITEIKKKITIRNQFRLEFIANHSKFDDNVALILIAEILDDYLDQRIASDKVLEGILKDILGNMAETTEMQREFSDLSQKIIKQHKLLENDKEHIMNEDQVKEQPAEQPAAAPAEQPAEQPAAAPAEQPAEQPTEDQRLSIINKYIDRLPKNITKREQVIASAGIFIDEIKTELACALNCSAEQVPEAIANYLGFTISDSENAPDSGVV